MVTLVVMPGSDSVAVQVVQYWMDCSEVVLDFGSAVRMKMRLRLRQQPLRSLVMRARNYLSGVNWGSTVMTFENQLVSSWYYTNSVMNVDRITMMRWDGHYYGHSNVAQWWGCLVNLLQEHSENDDWTNWESDDILRLADWKDWDRLMIGLDYRGHFHWRFLTRAWAHRHCPHCLDYHRYRYGYHHWQQQPRRQLALPPDNECTSFSSFFTEEKIPD